MSQPRSDEEAVAILIYSEATGLAMLKGQTVGKDQNYYVTLAQLEEITKRLMRAGNRGKP